ncbi:MAG: T9SS type A sorting domain-containing protein [Saprospiraceae bacterium]|nr:T9SS type A sorting domain-containing protein [Saprospiraceae bacterium]
MKNMRTIKFSFCLFITLLSIMPGLTAQSGWSQIYNFPQNQLNDVIEDSDGGFVALGSIYDSTHVLLMKTDADGNLFWATQHSEPGSFYFPNSLSKATGGYLVAGRTYSPQDGYSTLLMKFDDNGTFLWSTTDFLNGYEILYDAVEIADGSIWATGISYLNGDKHYLMHFDSGGNILSTEEGTIVTTTIPYISPAADGGFMVGGWSWNGTYSLLREKRDASGVVEASNTILSFTNGYYLSMDSRPGIGLFYFGVEYVQSGNSFMFSITKVDDDGNTLWTQQIPPSTFGLSNIQQNYPEINRVRAASDGGCFFTMFSGGVTGVVRLDANGNLSWLKTYQDNVFDHNGLFGVDETADGGCILAGFNFGDFSPTSPLMIRLLSDGSLFPNSLSGSIFYDANYDCQYDTDDILVKNYFVQAHSQAQDFYASSDMDGNYSMELPDGDFTVTVHSPNPFSVFCENDLPINLVGPGDHQVLNFADTIAPCPLLDVSMYSWTMRRCMENKYMGSVCNLGYVPVQGAYLEVALDDWLSFTSASLPATVQGQVVTLQLGDIGAGECVDFTLFFFLDCDVPPGLTHCSEATAYPNVWCGGNDPAWDGSSIRLMAECVGPAGDSVQFVIKNVGTGDMQQSSNFIVIEDHMIMLQGGFQLPSGGEYVLPAIYSNGATYRLEADQCPGHPGFSHPSIVVEGCGVENGLPISTGFVNMFPMDDADLFVDIDCRQNTASYDPNQKEAFPEGFMDDHQIERGTDLEYLIQFQNTGTDTAFLVVLKDTLSPLLDPTTIRPGAASHPYQFDLSGQGVATFSFPDIMLPDSNVNEPMSHGFASFRISQKPNIPWGSVIYNSAAIYFDFNAPVITNEVFHTVDTNFIEIINDVNELTDGFGELLAYPNPSAGDVIFEIPTERAVTATFHLFDPMGRQVLRENFTENKYRFQRNGLAAGVYFYRVEMDGDGVYSGKVILK